LSEIQRLNEAVTPLVQRAQAGDQQALSDVLRRCYQQIHRWALSLTGDRDDADDVTQDVLIRVHQHLGQYRERSSFTTWLYRVTRNSAGDFHRRRVRRERALERSAQAENRPPGAAATPLDELQASRVIDLVKALFEELPERQREVFDLVDLQDWSPVEVSQTLNMKPVTVRAHLHRARRAVRKRILERHPELMEELSP
jgi:RNA polymerase sigma-70 factor (ECF subfamily)